MTGVEKFLASTFTLIFSYQVMMDCWDANPRKRPTFKQLVYTLKRLEPCHEVRLIYLLKFVKVAVILTHLILKLHSPLSFIFSLLGIH